LAAFASSPHLHTVGGQLPAAQLLTHQASEALLAMLTHEAESRTVFTLGVYATARPASMLLYGRLTAQSQRTGRVWQLVSIMEW